MVVVTVRVRSILVLPLASVLVITIIITSAVLRRRRIVSRLNCFCPGRLTVNPVTRLRDSGILLSSRTKQSTDLFEPSASL